MSAARGSTAGLVEDLLRKPRDSLRDDLVRRALAGTYHDFRSSETFPKMRLASDLERVGYRDLSRRAMRGEYDDDDPEAEDARAFARDLAADPALAALWERMGTTDDPVVALELVRDHLKAQGLPCDESALLAIMAEVFAGREGR